ncbi:MAG: 5,5-dehydrodivanillate O-demethylase oxygenase subunit [Chloroflexota bacterium]|jgi:5,5'-dehydrodivanillate O-demethylase|nr:5,5-dehydrodivanillate O-demethylase oxygenase subunit [Chloroflexota bacterium]
MVLTKEQNERLTQTSAGTPAGELLRRYWHPIAVAAELTDEQPTRFVRILGEDLVLFKDKSGNVGLIQDHCAHRGASLLYGRVEERGIACAYHGWLYDTAGSCLECPAEPAGSMFHLTVRMAAYPVQKYAGLYWAYLGPAPAPELTKFDVLSRTDGRRRITVYPNLDCNWFAAAENAVDPWHLQILHQDQPRSTKRPANTTRGYVEDIEAVDFYLTSYGIMKKRVYKGGKVEEHPMIFPTHLRTGSLWLRTPIDDTHTLQWTVSFIRSEDGSTTDPADEEPEVVYLQPVKDPPNAVHPFARFNFYAPWGQILTQDMVMWETQGPISTRTDERLATSDAGIVMLRDLMFKEIAKVERGEDPMGVIRDPAQAFIDTNLSNERGRLSGIVTETVDWRAPGMETATADQLASTGYNGPQTPRS